MHASLIRMETSYWYSNRLIIWMRKTNRLLLSLLVEWGLWLIHCTVDLTSKFKSIFVLDGIVVADWRHLRQFETQLEIQIENEVAPLGEIGLGCCYDDVDHVHIGETWTLSSSIALFILNRIGNCCVHNYVGNNKEYVATARGTLLVGLEHAQCGSYFCHNNPAQSPEWNETKRSNE